MARITKYWTIEEMCPPSCHLLAVHFTFPVMKVYMPFNRNIVLSDELDIFVTSYKSDLVVSIF